MTNTPAMTIDRNELFKLACPTQEDTPFFNHCMRLAKSRGLSWEEALEYTIEMRGTDRI